MVRSNRSLHDDDKKRQRKDRQSGHMSEPEVVRKEKSPMFAPKLLARQSAVQYRAPRIGK